MVQRSEKLMKGSGKVLKRNKINSKGKVTPQYDRRFLCILGEISMQSNFCSKKVSYAIMKTLLFLGLNKSVLNHLKYQ